MKNMIILFLLIPTMLFAQVNETWRASTFTLQGLGTITKQDLWYLNGLDSNVQDQLDLKAALTDLQDHVDDTTPHPTISGASIQSPTRLDPKKDTEANLTTYAATAQDGEIVYATDTGEMFKVVGGELELMGGGTGVGSTDTMFVQDFEAASLTDFTHDTLSLSGGVLHGEVSATLAHNGSADKYFKEIVAVDGKFRDRNVTFKFDCMTTGGGTITVLLRDETNAADLTSELVTCPDQTGGEDQYISFDMPESTASISYKFTASQTALANTEIDDIEIYTTKFDSPTSALVQENDSMVKVNTLNGYGSTATFIKRFTNIEVSRGSDITYADSATQGASFTINTDGIYSISFTDDFTANDSEEGTGLSVNASGSQLTSSIVDIAAANKLAVQRERGLSAGQGLTINVSWTGYLSAGDVIRPHVAEAVTGTASRANFTIARAGQLKQIKVNKNSKVQIPNSSLTLHTSTSRGSTHTAVVKFDTVGSVKGDAFEINPLGDPALYGTHIRMKKKGRLWASTALYFGTANAEIMMTKNATTLTANDPANIFGSYHYQTTTAGNSSRGGSGTTDVEVGDIIRVQVNSINPVANTNQNYFTLHHMETEVQVSVSNTLPQFSEDDLIFRAGSNAGTAVTASVTDIPFTTVFENSDGISWGGSQFTIPEDGVYTISSGIHFTAGADRAIELYVDGARFVRFGDNSTNSTHKGEYTGKFTRGQVLSIRAGNNGGTLTNSTIAENHYLSIVKVGKPNVTGVDVTPFVDIEYPTNQHSTYFSTSTSSATTFTGALSSDTGSGIYSYNSTTGLFTMLKKGRVHLSSSARANGMAAVVVYVYVNGSSKSVDYTDADTNWAASANYSAELNAGDTFQFQYNSGARNYTSISVLAEATSDTIITPVEAFSTDSNALTFASSTSYTLSTLTSAPVGTFITYSYAAGGNTRTQCTTAPTQTTGDMASNGIRLYTRPYDTASTCALPSNVAVQVGKGLKGISLELYKSTGKTTGGDLEYVMANTTSANGFRFRHYDALTGVLMIDGGVHANSTNTNHSFIFNDISTQSNGYLVINGSKSPALVGLPYAGTKVATVTDVKASGTSGGASVAATWNTRTLNTLVDNQGIGVTLGTNQFTLPAGTYYIEASAPAYDLNTHKTRLRNITAGTTAIVGTSEYADPVNVANRSFLQGEVTVTTATTFELQHYTQSAVASNGLGVAVSSGESEIYAQVKITKVK